MVHLVGGEWVEVKTLAIGEATRNRREEVCTQQLSYCSRLCDAASFEHATLLHTHRRGLCRASEVCAVQDGAEWLQGLTDYHRADAVRILDFAHAAEYLNEIGQAVRATGGRLPGRWLDGVLHRLRPRWSSTSTQAPGLVSCALSQFTHPGETRLLTEARSAHAISDLSRGRLAHWFRQRGKCQQAGRGSTTQRGWHALGSTEREPDAGAAQCGLQS